MVSQHRTGGWNVNSPVTDYRFPVRAFMPPFIRTPAMYRQKYAFVIFTFAMGLRGASHVVASREHLAPRTDNTVLILVPACL